MQLQKYGPSGRKIGKLIHVSDPPVFIRWNDMGNVYYAVFEIKNSATGDKYQMSMPKAEWDRHSAKINELFATVSK